MIFRTVPRSLPSSCPRLLGRLLGALFLCVALVGGGCLAPVAAHHDGERLTALVADEDGGWVERRTGSDPESVARELLPYVR